MLKNVNWEKLINSIICYTGSWEKLIGKIVFSKSMDSSKYYFSKDGNNYIDLYTKINGPKILELDKSVRDELNVIRDDLGKDEILFITMSVEKAGDVVIKYRDIKNGKKVPFDEILNYKDLKEEDK